MVTSNEENAMNSFLLACMIAVAVCPMACGSDHESTEPEAKAQALCSSYCDWKSRCSKTTTSCTDGSCVRDTESIASKWRDSYPNGVAQCFRSLPCEQSDDYCGANFALADPAYPNILVVQDCLTRRTECGGTFADDYCRSLAALTDSARAEADQCRSKPCEEARDCLKAAGAFTY
jgi:hypothetical protein